MKFYFSFLAFALALGLTACGQIGPLYLPGSKPPIAVGPEVKPEPETPKVPAAATPTATPATPATPVTPAKPATTSVTPVSPATTGSPTSNK